MNTISNFISQELMNAIGWTLLHSLWQGALIALILGVSLIFLQKKSAALRYGLSAAAMILMLVVFVTTFTISYQQEMAASRVVTELANPSTDYDYGITYITTAQSQNILGVVVDYFNHHLPSIVVLWFLGIVVMSLRFLGGLAYIQRLRHRHHVPLDDGWQHRLNELSDLLHIRRTVQLVESTLVQVPMVVGYLKPMILLPIGAVNGLSAQQVEAILAHELAHISRHDYLINIIQSVLDVLFFYHPAVWWMSNTIRTEREHCCDDIALRLCGDSLNLAKALANLEVMKKNKLQLSVAFTGNKNQLFNRIARVLGKPVQQRTSVRDGFGFALILILFLVVSTFNANANLKTTNVDNPLVEWYITDTLPPTPPVPPAPPTAPKEPKAPKAIEPVVAPAPPSAPKTVEPAIVPVPEPAAIPKPPKPAVMPKPSPNPSPKPKLAIPKKDNNMALLHSRGVNDALAVYDLPRGLASVSPQANYEAYEEVIANFQVGAVAYDFEFDERWVDTNIIDWQKKLQNGDVIVIEEDDKIIIYTDKKNDKTKHKIIIGGGANELRFNHAEGSNIFVSPEGEYNKAVIIRGSNDNPFNHSGANIFSGKADKKSFKEAEKAYKKGLKAKAKGNSSVYFDEEVEKNLFYSYNGEDAWLTIAGDSRWDLESKSFEKVKQELLKDGLIENIDKLSIEIKNSSKFKINGKEVPDHLKEKYRKLLGI